MWLWLFACAPVPPVADADGDHFAGFHAGGVDCDDNDPTVYPSAPEVVCDRVDQDCDGDAGVGFRDADGDGHGAGPACTAAEGPEGFVRDGNDCDDSNAANQPGAAEVCDGVDNDCDGAIDDGAQRDRLGFPDRDGDDYGETTAGTLACEWSAGLVDRPGDCDDTDPTRSPARPEECADRIDQDCDGEDALCAPYLVGDAVYHVEGNLGPSLCAGDLDDDGDTELVLGTGYRHLSDGGWWLYGTDATEPSFWFIGAPGLGGACGVADLDRDGTDDLVLPTADAVFVLYGEPGVLDGETLRDGPWPRTTELSGEIGAFVEAPVLRGDVDNDGDPDVTIGAPFSAAGSGRGAVYVLGAPFDSATTLGDAAGLQIHGDSSGGRGFGASLGLLDADGDGQNELVVGDPTNSGDVARLYLFPAQTRRASLRESDATRVFQTASTRGFGEILASGDVAGDGYGALLTVLSGVVVVLPAPSIERLTTGTHAPEEAVETMIYGPPGFGRAISIGDFDGDGIGDVTVTALEDEDADGGRGYLFLGPVPDGSIDTAGAHYSVIGSSGGGLGVSTEIVVWPDASDRLWLVGAASGQMYGFAD